MTFRFPGRSIRGRMLLAAILIEATMLTLLVANSMRLLTSVMTEQAAQHAAQMTPVLKAALVAPLAQQDSATVKAILDECCATEGIDYLAVLDARGKEVALSGWDPARPLPAADRQFHLFGADNPRYNVVSPIEVAGQSLGSVHFGLNLSQIVVAHQKLLTQGILIALGELLLSMGLLTVVGIWLTRHLTALTEASEAVAGGNLIPPKVWEGSDDVGRLGVAFNAMSGAIRERIQQLTEARDIQTTLAQDIAEGLNRLDEITRTMGDGLYVIDMTGRITFANHRMEEILGWSPAELIGQNAHELFHEDKGEDGPFPSLSVEAGDVLRTGQPFRSKNASFQRKDGVLIRVSKAINPILRERRIIGAVISFQDVTDSPRVAQALKISEERFAFAIEGSGDGLWDWDLPSNSVVFSKTWLDMIGYLPNELSSDVNEWVSRVHPEDRARTLQEVRTHLDGATPLYLSEHRFQRKDGSYLWVLDRGRVVERDAMGLPTRMIGTHSDIGHRKAMELALQQRDLILDAVSRCVVSFVDSDDWEAGVKGFLASLGTASEASRVRILKRQDRDGQGDEVFMDQLLEWRAEGMPPQLLVPEFHQLPMRASGFGRWVDELRADRMISGRVASFPESERPLLEAQGIQSLLVMPVHVRGSWWGMIAYDECAGTRFWSSSEQEILRLAGRALGSKIERTETRLELEQLVLERTRELDQTNLNLIAEMDTRQDVEAANKAVMVALEQSRKMESIGRLAAGIAHEINTPTQFLGNNLGFLKDGYRRIDQLLKVYEKSTEDLPKPQADALKQLTEQLKLGYLKAEMPQAIDESLEGIDRITKIVSAMKEFSHPGGKGMNAVDVNHCLVTTATVTRNEWKYVAELKLDLDSNLPLIHGLPAELNQVFLNLIVNAADAIRDRSPSNTQPGQITLSTQSLTDAVEIRISDNGMGMPEAIHKQIFEPFFTTKQVGKGTGQGLTVCYQVIVTRHGGTIHCESVEGQGTTFILRLPKAGVDDRLQLSGG